MERTEKKYFEEMCIYDEKIGVSAVEYEITYDEKGEVIDCHRTDYCIVDNEYDLTYEDFFEGDHLNPMSEYYTGEEITKEKFDKLYKNNLNYTI